MPARSGHRELHPQRSDRVGEDPVNAVTLEGQHRLGRQLPASMTCAAQPAEPFLADGEHDHQRQLTPGKAVLPEAVLGDGDGGRYGDGVVTDPRTRKPAVPFGDTPMRCLAEHVIHVHEHGQAVRRRAERPDQVSGIVDATAAGRVVQPAQQPVNAHPLAAGAAVQLGQRHGVRGDRRRIDSRVCHVIWPASTGPYHTEPGTAY